MKTILLSTTSLWNCGDDFIREGVLELLHLRPDVRILWWNRGYGIKNAYANFLDINLPLTDYFITAGTPEWMYKNEHIYKYCLKNRIPFSMIGIGTRNAFSRLHFSLMRKIAKSGLCEIVLVRDKNAAQVFEEFNFRNISLIPDPAFFMKSLKAERTIAVLGWRDHFIDYEPSFLFRYPHRWVYGQLSNKILRRQQWGKSKENYNKLMRQIFSTMPEQKMVIVHDNREVQKAQSIFGAKNVFYSTDYHEIFKKYSRAKSYIGSRIHGAIPSLIYGASVCLIYGGTKAEVLRTSTEIWSNYIPNIFQKVKLRYLKYNQINIKELEEDPLDQKIIAEAIDKEKKRIHEILRKQPILSSFIL